MSRENCECCEGTQKLTPAKVVNRPGLSSLAYRVGTHGQFLETMKARLSNMAVEAPVADDPSVTEKAYPLSLLTTRAAGDPSIALLDSWATVADVLTFYQERIANEGFLHTATERRSVLELARLIGYALRPGVASSVFLALELDSSSEGKEVLITPHEIKAQSVPGPGELPQVFENGETLEARFDWNKLQPRSKRPQTLQSIQKGDVNGNVRLYLKGINANLKVNDVMLITGGGGPLIYHVAKATSDPDHERTLVIFQEKAVATEAAFKSANYDQVVAVALNYLSSPPGKERSKVRTEMAQRVMEHLKELVVALQASAGDAVTSQKVLVETMARLSEERDVAVGEQYTKLAPWLSEMVEELEAAQSAFVDGSSSTRMMASGDSPQAKGNQFFGDPLKQAVVGLTKPASVPPRNTLNLTRNLARSFGLKADTGLKMSSAFDSQLSKTLPAALENVQVTQTSPLRAFVFRKEARPFGHNAQPRAKVQTGSFTTYEDWKIKQPLGISEDNGDDVGLEANDGQNSLYHTPSKLYLDGEYEIQSNAGWVIIEGPETSESPLILQLDNGELAVNQESLTAYGVSGKTTRLNLLDGRNWITDTSTFDVVRATKVYVESEELALTNEPLEVSICDGNTDLIELDRLYSGMQSGRWVVVTGERTDVTDENQQPISSVKASEVVMLSEVIQDISNEDGLPYYYTGGGVPLAGDSTHTWIRLAKKLEYCYGREKITIFGNVVKATHGETQKETLGNGDASQTFQKFSLKQAPLTYTASPIPVGAESSLDVYVNDVRWHEVDTLAGLDGNHRSYVTKIDDDGKTSIIFGNGEHGTRPPTGLANIRAEYRKGIGQPGNVSDEQISLLMSKPLGVQGVINPVRASGGADRESCDTARKNAPRTVTALDRLVSLSDYADFARTFAGIGKSAAALLSDGHRQLVHVTIAGADDIPIDETSDLYHNLLLALRRYGDPDLPIVLQVRELLLLFLSANIKISLDYQWDPVVKAVRTKLLDAFGFEHRELGQDMLLSEAIAVIQSVPGVEYVDVDALGGVPEKYTFIVNGKPLRRLLTPQEISEGVQSMLNLGKDSESRIVHLSSKRRMRQPLQRIPVNLSSVERGLINPAQLAYLTPDVDDTLVLNQVK